jgi:hypothetical protein
MCENATLGDKLTTQYNKVWICFEYQMWGFPDHPEMKIFTLFLGIKVVMSTSNFMDFQGIEYYKTGNAINTLDHFPIMHVSALFSYCFQLYRISCTI